MKMRTLIVLLGLITAVAVAGLQPVALIPPPKIVTHRTAARQWARTGAATPWVALERLTPAERANARIHIEPGTPGVEDAVRAIERPWNSGDYDEALAQFRNLGGSHDLRNAFVGINWRTPIPTLVTEDWGPNVRVGNRDSVYCMAFDCNSVNNNLLVALLRRYGAVTHLNFELSTDGGTSWTETFDGNASGMTPPGYLEAVCTGAHFYVTYPVPDLNIVVCLKVDASNGQMVQFPSGAWADTVFRPAPDTITEIAMCSAEEEWPGQRVCAFARTTRDSLLYAWADSTGQPWTRDGTNVNWCTGGMIDCAVNTGYPSGGNWLWASFMYKRAADTLCPALAWMDDSTGTWHAAGMPEPTTVISGTSSLAAWHDTLLMAYTHELGTAFFTQGLVSYDGGAHFSVKSIPDTLANRETPDVTGAHGDGFAVVHREYGSDHAIMYTHAGYAATNWSAQETVSNHAPDNNERPRIQWIAPGVYGVAYVSSDTSDYNSVWFNRSDWNGVAERQSAKPTLFGLHALPTEGGVRLAFNNPAAGKVRLRVLDATGRLAHDENLTLTAGQHTLSFAGTPAGIYFARLDAAGRIATAKFFIAR
jgi:hypothetical protein